MPELREIADKVRSKNAGPFWVTLDIFCPDDAAFCRVRDGLPTQRVAKALGVPPADLKRFDMADLGVVKFSLPRPRIQGTVADRDMHGAGWAVILDGLQVD